MNMLTRTLVKTEHGSVVFVHHRLSDIETVVCRYYEDHGHDVKNIKVVKKNYESAGSKTRYPEIRR